MNQKPTIPEVVPLFLPYYRQHGAWGSLHVVLDDHNVEDHSVRYCIEWAEESGDTQGAELGRILLRMSKTQRGKLSRVIERASRQPDEQRG